jgi:hypothetical protein
MDIQCNKHFFLLLGVAVTALAMPFGLVAAALATTLSSVCLVAWQHYSGRPSDAGEMAWMLAGGAAYLLWVKALFPALG